MAMHEIKVSSTRNTEIIGITDEVAAAVAKSAVNEGICLVFVPHTTASVIIIEADGAVEQDILNSLSNIVPKNTKYVHQYGSEPAHGAAHVKSAILGSSQAIPVKDGKLQLGTWQSICFCEFDGPRSDRKVYIEVVGT